MGNTTSIGRHRPTKATEKEKPFIIISITFFIICIILFFFLYLKSKDPNSGIVMERADPHTFDTQPVINRAFNKIYEKVK